MTKLEDAPAEKTHSHRKRPWIAVIIVVVALAGLAGGYGLAITLENPAQRAAKAEPPPKQPLTTTITGDARSLTLTAPVTLTQAPGSGILAPAGTTAGAVVTSVSARVGQVLKEGSLIADLSGQPLIALALSFPLYRDIAVGDFGPDVAELSKALVSAGYLTKPVGRTAPADNTLLKAMDRLLKDVGYNGTKLRPPPPDTNTGTDQVKTEPGGQAPAKAPTLLAKATWFAQIGSGSHQITSVAISTGSVISDLSKPLLELNARPPEIQAWLDESSAKFLTAGAPGSIGARDGSEPNRILVTVTSVDQERTIDPSSQSKGFRMVMTPGSPLPATGLQDQVATFTVPLAQEGTPTIPETAVFTDPSGETTVRLAVPGSSSEAVPIRISTCAEGWCTYEDPSQRVTIGTRVLISE